MAVIGEVQVPQIPQVVLQAHWSSNNVHLVPRICNIPDIWEHADGSCFYKIYLCFTKTIQCMTRFFLTSFKRMCARLIIPVTHISRAERRKLDREWSLRWTNPEDNPLMAAYTPNELQVTAPDGTLVKGVFYRHQRGEGQDVPTIVCFGPNQGLAKADTWDWLLKKGIRTPIPFNVVVLDYRPGLVEFDESVLDGDAIVQTLHEKMGVSKHNIHIMGYSIGGGVSAQVRHLHADAGNYVSLRSFSSIGDVIKHSDIVDFFIPQCLQDSYAGPWIRPLLAVFVSVLNWGIETQELLRDMKERALVVYHPQDPIIPVPASAAEWVETAQVVEMRMKGNVQMNLNLDHHNTPLRDYEDVNGQSIRNRIMNFILKTDQFQRRDAAQAV